MSPPEPAPAVPGAAAIAPTGVRWKVLFILVVMSFVAYVLRTNMSVAGEAMMRDLGLSNVQLGMILAAFAWGYGLFQFPGGVAGQVWGSRRVLTVIAVGWGAVNLLTGLIPGTETLSLGAVLWTLIVLRFLMGVVQAPVFPVMAGCVVGSWFPPTGWALPNGLSSAGLTVGAAATGPLIAWLSATVGWRQSFVLTAPLGFAVGLWWWWYGRDTPAQHADVNAAELALIDEGRRSSEGRAPRDWWRVLRDRNVLLLTAAYFCMNYTFFIFFNWFFVYLVQVRGFTILESGFVATLPWLAGAMGAAAGGAWCDGLTRRWGIRLGCRVPAVLSMIAVAVLLFLGAAATDPWVAIFLLSLSFGATQLTEGPHWAATIAVGGRHAPAATGILNTGGNIVGGFGAILVPITAEAFGWVPALATGSLFALISAALWMLIRADEPMA